MFSRHPWRAATGVALAAIVLAPLTALPASATTDGTGVVINEVYLSGGSANAAFKNKFVELYNPTAAAVSLSGMSIQYRPAGGTGAFSRASALTGSIAAKGYYLFEAGSNGANGAELPTADSADTGFNPSGTTGTIALAKGTTALSVAPGSVTGDANIVDLIGYGASNTFEGALSPAPAGNSVPQSIDREDFKDTDDNSADFSLSDTVTPKTANGVAGDPGSGDPTGDPSDPTGDPTGDPADPIAIADIQGTTDTSPETGKTVTTTGVVTAAYPTGGFNGYYIQTPGTGGTIGADHKSSDAIFVFSSATMGSVKIGDYVQVTGAVSEFKGTTELAVTKAADLKKLTDEVDAPAPAKVAFPATDAAREALEGMLIAPQGDFTVTDTYTTNQYAEVPLAASSSPLVSPTAVGDPGSDAYKAAQARATSELVVLDDGSSLNFFTNDAAKDMPLPYVSNDKPVRVGEATAFTKPVILEYRNNAWNFQPTQQLTVANAADVQPVSFTDNRQDTPDLKKADLTLATFNVLNYFPTTGEERSGCTYYDDRDGNHIAVNNSDAAGCGVRGAADAANLKRQQDKIVTAINKLGANVVSLEEIENSNQLGKDRDFGVSTLVTALNQGLSDDDKWSFVPSPTKLPAHQDVIRTAFIYKAADIAPVGTSTILDTTNFGNARQPNAQAFKPAGGSDADTFVVIANHLKSKGAGGTGDNADSGDGAGFYNGDRTRQAHDLVDFAAAQEEAHSTDKVFMVGDFNSYAAEDPIDVVKGAGFVDEGVKSGKYSYSFDSAVGSLDYIFASPAADKMVADSDIWNINSGESVALEYSRYNYNATNFYRPDQYRSSDHDPVLVSMDLGGAPSGTTKELNLVNINDFHGRIDANTVKFAGTIEQLMGQYPDSSAFLSAGDNIGASLFASSTQGDKPTLDVLNALKLQASATGNHEFDQGYDDLVGRVTEAANFPYLAANVYRDDKPVLPGYQIVDIDGVKVGVVGAITEETPALVSPDGIKGLTFGDPVEAVNRVTGDLTDGDPANGEADVIVAEYHEGSGSGVAENATLEEQIAAGGAFADIVNKTSNKVSAIFNGHTHAQYAWDAPVPGEAGKTRPVLQTGSYGEFIGQIVLDYNTETGAVTTKINRNVARTTDDDAALVDQFPAVKQVQGIVKDALDHASEVGDQVIGQASADITTAYIGDTRDDRMSESTMGNFVADAMLATLSSPERGSAEIGVVNPGGLRAELTKGDITYAEANAVLPFLNNLWTTSLTGAQFKTALEQQWQRDAAGKVPSTPYLQLGLSKNVHYTFDPTRPEGDRITSIIVNGEPIDMEREYRIGSFNFLLTGGDNFRAFGQGTDTKDTGLVDRDAWIDYITKNSPIAPSYDRRSVQVEGLPTGPVTEGQEITLKLAKLDLTSLGSPKNTEVTASLGDGASAENAAFSAKAAKAAGTTIATAEVKDGAATLAVTLPKGSAGAQTLVITAKESGTTVTVPLTVKAAAGSGDEPTDPGTDGPGSDQPGDGGQPGSDQPGGNQPGTDGPGAGQPGGNGGGQPGADQPGEASGSAPLVRTGAEVGAGVLLALVLLLAGSAAVFVVRRRRTH